MPNDSFYNLVIWQRLRKAKLAANPICEYCGQALASEVDHILALRAGGDPLAWANLASACGRCHRRKTNYIEKLGRDRVPVKGCDALGRPLDPAHWWNKRRR